MNNNTLTLIKKRSKHPFYLLLIMLFMFSNISNASVTGTDLDPVNSNKVLICHVPNGNFNKAYTISTSVAALSAHSNDYDDYDGPCVAPAPVAPFVECAAPLGAHFRFNFANPTQVTNNANIGQVGTVFRFADVTTDTDALVTIVANQNATLLQIDVPSLEEDPTGTGLKWALQPEIQPVSQLMGKYYIDFLISFVDKGSTVPSIMVKDGSFLATAADIDSDGVNSHLKEFVEFNKFHQYFLEQQNNLTVNTSNLLGNSKGFEISTAANLPNITVFNTPDDPDASKHIATLQYQQKNSFRYRAGINFTQDYTASADKRLFSLYFNCPDFNDPLSSLGPTTNVDYGDAPSSYGNASHALPTSGNPLIYLGTLFPDGEVLTLNTANGGGDGTGDDLDNTDDEDGISSFPALYSDANSYTLPLAAITTHNQTGVSGTLYGYIDFNQDGDFADAGESTSISVADLATQPTGNLVWSGFPTLTTGSTYARFRMSTDSGLTSGGLASDGEVEDYTLSITEPLTCSALSGDINGGLATTTKLTAGDKLFLASSTLSNATGHLKAFHVDNKGLPETEVWDAANAMLTQDERATRLFSTASDGTKVLFSALDNTFLSSGTPDGQTLKNTIAAAVMGAISPESNVTVINDVMNVGLYLTTSAYKTFYSDTISKRSASNGASKPARVLVSSDDGFLYAFDQYNGDLGWGWIPRTVAQALNTADFTTQHMMQGKITVIDVKSADNYNSYVIGGYKQGLGHYVLKLGSDSSLDSVIWDTDHTTDPSPATHVPNQGQPAYFSDVNGTLYMTYVTTDAANISTLHIRNVIDASLHEKIILNFTATSVPYVMRDFGSTYAPAKKTLYLGDNLGKIHSAALLTTSATIGILETASTITTEINNMQVAALNTLDTSPVLFIGAAGSSTSRAFYLHAQSNDRLTVFKYKNSSNAWQADWTTYIGGAGAWENGSSSLTAKATIQSLPTEAILTDNAFVVANSIVLPVSLPASNNGCYNEAFYYFYKLTDGSLPTQTFLNTTDKTFIGGSISLGNGNARTLQMSKIKGNHLRLGFGMADQKTDVTTISGINKTFYINELSAKVLRGRKELRQ